ncbi:MAG: hypothetical protein J6Y78_02290 [Paludibacteraceae bacterium]|nr:hypothetical protein [Paludibacteraceae bacterium]
MIRNQKKKEFFMHNLISIERLKKKIRIFLAFLPFIVWGCSSNNDASIVDFLNSIDYSIYSDLTIRKRNGAHIIQYENQLYIITHSFNRGYVFNKEIDIELKSKIIKAIEDIDDIFVQAISVDSIGNICVALSRERKCTDYFYKPANLMYDSLYAEKYSAFDSEWYMDRVCSE